MYEIHAMGVQADNVSTVVGNRGKVVEKPSVNVMTESTRFIHDWLWTRGESVGQIAMATALYDSLIFNPYTVSPEASIDGIGVRRFNANDRRKGIQAVQNVLQRLSKSGKASWLVRVESDGSLSDDKGNAWGYTHSLNLPVTEADVDLWIEDAWSIINE